MYYNHNIRTSIQEWKSRLYKATWEQFGHQLKYCLNNIESNRQIFGFIQEANIKFPYTEETLNQIVDNIGYGSSEMSFENEMHQTSFCYLMLKQFIKLYNSYDLHRYNILGGSDFEKKKQNIIEGYFTPIFYYLHDKLDKSNSTIYLLEKYKRRTEWFTYQKLLETYSKADKNYEQIFEDDLRQFLFDQGIDYPFSTPKSTSGRSDIIGAIDTEDPIVIEIKVIDKKRTYGKQRIIKGFSQVIKYTNDYNKDVGYLVVFNVDKAEVNFDLNEKSKLFPPMLTINNKTYFFIIINLSSGSQASKIGKIEVITITENELTK
jgi:hypothetical protein